MKVFGWGKLASSFHDMKKIKYFHTTILWYIQMMSEDHMK